jgi:hypothetical protein
MVFLALFLGCLEYTLEEGPRWNWFSDQTILTTAWISGLSLDWRSSAGRLHVSAIRSSICAH